jgi:putative hydrolases of HD superfamily
MTDTRKLADIAELLARRALAFGEIDRSICRHPDGRPETDTTHTVMLAWLAPALADLLYPHLDPLLVAAFAVVHDAVEVHAGDTLTLRITPAGQAAKRARELAAAATWAEEFGAGLPWLPAMIIRYEAREEPECRFAWAVDKSLPALVHFSNGGRYLAEYGVTADEVAALRPVRHAEIAACAAEFPALLSLRDEIARRLETLLRDREERS